jgi:hypothetical protein
MLDYHGYMHVHAFTRTRARSLLPIRTHAHALTQTNTHRPISNAYCFSSAKIFRDRSLFLLYTYIAFFCPDSQKLFLHHWHINMAAWPMTDMLLIVKIVRMFRTAAVRIIASAVNMALAL